jgi:hypothetical protein
MLSGKCLRTIADMLKLFGTCLSEGSRAYNIVTFAMNYLAALKGQ